MKREKIKSLAEYIELISKSEFQDSYFRGENDKYDKISSSLIRNIDNINDFIGVEEVYDNLQNAYYQEIGYQLDKTQEENFLAFSQIPAPSDTNHCIAICRCAMISIQCTFGTTSICHKDKIIFCQRKYLCFRIFDIFDTFCNLLIIFK